MKRLTVFGALLACLLVGCSFWLRGCGPKGPYTSGGRTASAWAEALRQPEVEVRRKAAAKLGPLTLTDPAALPATLVALRDEDAQVRLAAVRSLRIYSGPKAPEVVPALRDVGERDPDPKVREAAAKAVQELTSR